MGEKKGIGPIVFWWPVAFMVLLIGNGHLPVTDPVESNYALTAKEMWQAGNWLTPQIYGEYWFDKPILTYWLLELSYAVFGATAFASRLPGALCGASTVALTAALALRFWRDRVTAWYAGGFLLTMLAFWSVSRGVVTDPALLLWTAVTFYGAYRGVTEDRRRYMVLAYAGAGLACLTKGPVGLVLPGLILLAWLWVAPAVRRWRRLFDPAGIAVFVIVGLSWYGLMYVLHGGEYLLLFLGLHNFTRATVAEHPADAYWYYYLLVVPLSALPWSPLALREGWLSRRAGDAAVRLCLSWLLVTVVFYSLMATKYVTYAYITVVPLALLAARGWRRIGEEDGYGSRWWLLLPALFWLTVAYAAVGIIAQRLGGATSAVEIYVLPALLALVSAWVLLRGRRRTAAGLAARAVLVTAVASLALVTLALPSVLAGRSAMPAAATWSTLPGASYCYHGYTTSFPFYTGRTPTLLIDEEKAQRVGAWVEKYTMPREKKAAFRSRLETGDAISVWVPRSERKKFAREHFPRLTRVASYAAGDLYRTEAEQ